MRLFLYVLLIIYSEIFLSNEKEIVNEKNNTKPDSMKNKLDNETKKSDNKKLNKTKSNKKPKNEKKEQPPLPPIESISVIPEDVYNIPNDNVYSLTDDNFDNTLQNGENYKWFVLLYSDLCNHCDFARREIRKIFPDYQYSKTLRFAEIEINKNPLTNKRFNIAHVPFIFMLKNNKMIILDLYPRQKNLKKFIETDYRLLLPEEIRPFPPKKEPKRSIWENIKKFIEDVTSGINEILKEYGFKFEFTPILLIFLFALIIVSIFVFDHFCGRFCHDEEKPKGKEKDSDSDRNSKENEEEIKENKIEEDNNNEEEKIRREKEKEKEKKVEGKKEDKKNVKGPKKKKKE
jgi:hypothetical protein